MTLGPGTQLRLPPFLLLTGPLPGFRHSFPASLLESRCWQRRWLSQGKVLAAKSDTPSSRLENQMMEGELICPLTFTVLPWHAPLFLEHKYTHVIVSRCLAVLGFV